MNNGHEKSTIDGTTTSTDKVGLDRGDVHLDKLIEFYQDTTSFCGRIKRERNQIKINPPMESVFSEVTGIILQFERGRHGGSWRTRLRMMYDRNRDDHGVFSDGAWSRGIDHERIIPVIQSDDIERMIIRRCI